MNIQRQIEIAQENLREWPEWLKKTSRLDNFQEGYGEGIGPVDGKIGGTDDNTDPRPCSGGTGS